LLSSFKNLPIMIDRIKQHLETRIAELNKADADFCKDRWDMTKPKMERDLYRGFSNEVTFARQELERTLKFLNELSKGAVISSFCQCEKPEWCECEVAKKTKTK